MDEYQNAIWSQADIAQSERGRRSNRLAEILSVRLVSSAGKDIGGAPISEDVFIKTRFRTVKRSMTVKCALDLSTKGTLIFRTSDTEARPLPEAGTYEALAKIPRDLLAELPYIATVSCIFKRDGEPKEYPLVVYNALQFLVFGTDAPDAPASAGSIASATSPRSWNGPSGRKPMLLALRRWLGLSGPVVEDADGFVDRKAQKWVIEPARLGLIARAEELWRYRRILWFFASRRIKERYEDKTLGRFWLFFQPLAPILISTMIFGNMLQVPSDGVPYFLFFLAGMSVLAHLRARGASASRAASIRTAR